MLADPLTAGEYKIADAGKVHLECYTGYALKTAPQCIQCSKPCFPHSSFSGDYCQYEQGRVHAEW
jgi:hypothetical protein